MENNQEKNESAQAQEAPDAVIMDDVNATPAEESAAEATGAVIADEEADETALLKKKVEELEAQVEKEKKEYVFLMAEMDNMRKRNLKERSELIKNAAESAFKGLLPIVDDMERAIKHGEFTDDAEALKEGMKLIYKKLMSYFEKNGVKEMELNGEPFDSDKAEAVAMIPAPEESLKGKVLDTVEKGYTINDKVLRHAKVAVGQ